MRVAVVGSREVIVENIGEYIGDCDEIVSGGARGVDSCAAEYARKNSIKLTEFLPKYRLYGRAAPIVRNREIVDYADRVVVFWNGRSRGTLSVIEYAKNPAKTARSSFANERLCLKYIFLAGRRGGRPLRSEQKSAVKQPTDKRKASPLGRGGGIDDGEGEIHK